MKILFLGNTNPQGSAFQRAAALARLGHEVKSLDPLTPVPRSRLWNKLNQWTGYVLVSNRTEAWLAAQVSGQSFDLIWVDGGVSVSPSAINRLHRYSLTVINYNLDDPTGRRDGSLWKTFTTAIPYYDLLVAVRPESTAEYRALGAKRVMQVFRSYDEVAHAPQAFDPAEQARWKSELAFVGTWMPERGPMLARLIAAGLPLAIYGDRWHRSPEWPQLKRYWRGPAVYQTDYVQAIQYARVALGLLSKGNRDQHTQRTAEIPFIGTAFCAESSTEHRQLFRDTEHAMLWRNLDECIRKCRQLLGDESLRRRVAAAGRQRIIELGLSNEHTLQRILQRVEPAKTLANRSAVTA